MTVFGRENKFGGWVRKGLNGLFDPDYNRESSESPTLLGCAQKRLLVFALFLKKIIGKTNEVQLFFGSRYSGVQPAQIVFIDSIW